MDIKSLWQKLDQIVESSDAKSTPETKKKKPDADGDGVPDWADKKPGKDDNQDKEKVEEGFFGDVKDAFTGGMIKKAKEKIPAEHHKHYDFDSIKSIGDAKKLVSKAKSAGHINEQGVAEGYDSGDAYDKWDPKHPHFVKNFKKFQASNPGATLTDFIAHMKKGVAEGFDVTSSEKKLKSLQNKLRLAKEQRERKGGRVESTQERRLQQQMDQIADHIRGKKGVAEDKYDICPGSYAEHGDLKLGHGGAKCPMCNQWVKIAKDGKIFTTLVPHKKPGVAEATGNPGMPTPHDQGRADAKKGRPYDNPYDQPGEQQEHSQYKKGYEQGKQQGVAEDAPELKNVKHFSKPGGYGRKIDKDDESGDTFHSSDIDDTDATASAPAVKRGRGRPMKGGDSETGQTKKYDTDTLASWIIGNKPKNIGKIGKVSHVNRLKEYMEMVERKTIVESFIAEGASNELSQIVDDIIEGRLDIYDIISGKFTPANKIEDFVQKALTKSYEQTARDHGLHADDDGDEIIGIMYNDIHDIIGNAYSKGLDEQTQMPGLPGTMSTSSTSPATTATPPGAATTATTATSTQAKSLPVLAQGKQVGSAPTPQAVQAATPMVNDILNKKQALGKMGVTVTGLEESLSDTMNRFSSILNESTSRRTLSESKEAQLVMEGTLEEIMAVHPHEHKMFQEGWGMDESLYEALCDHYYKEGRIPRKVWHGSSDDLRKCVEECYLQDTQPLMSEDTSMGIIPENLTTDSFETSTQDQFDLPVESEEKDIRRHAMSKLIDELDETEESDGGLSAAHRKAKEISGKHGVVQHIERDPETGHHRVSDWYDSDTTVATYNNGKLKEDMNESKKPSAGMTAGEKSALVKKAKAGKDIGKPGKGFEKIAKKAAEKYGSAEKGKKVAAAAMWKNAAPTNEARSEEEWTQAALAKGKRGRDARDNPTASVALNKQSKSSRDAAKELAKLRDTQRDLDEGQLNEKFGKEAKLNPAKKGMFKGKTKDELQKQLANLKKTGPHKLGSPENTKMKELQFAIRAKSDWGKIDEGKFGQMDADLADLSPAEFKKEYGMTKAEARAKHGGKAPESTKKEKVEESIEFSSWDNQLSSLLKPSAKQAVSESAQIKKQMINESANELSTMLQFAGLKNVQQVMEEFNASIYSNDGDSSASTDGSDNPPQLAMPTGMGMSQQTEEDDESSVVEPMMSDEVIGGLSAGDKESAQSDNDHLSFFKKMLSHGQSEVKTDKPKAESGEQSGIPASTSQSPVSGETSKEPVTKEAEVEEDKGDGNLANNAKPYDKITQGDVIAGRLGKDEMGGKKKEESTVKEDADATVSGNGDNEEEQAEVGSDAQRDAGLAQGDANFFSSENSSTMAECDGQDVASDGVIGDILAKLTQMLSQEQSQPAMSTDEPVVVDIQGYADEEPQDEQHCDQCQSCGQAMLEGHQCMESLNEWANSPTGESADEQFQTDMEFMTKVISGGLNNQKQDQTTLPSTRVVTKDESKEVDNSMGAMLRKLSGIN